MFGRCDKGQCDCHPWRTSVSRNSFLTSKYIVQMIKKIAVWDAGTFYQRPVTGTFASLWLSKARDWRRL